MSAWLSTNKLYLGKNQKYDWDGTSAQVPTGRRLQHPVGAALEEGQLPAGTDRGDRAKFDKLRDYLLRIDDAVTCKTCGKKFEIPSQHSLVFVDQLEAYPTKKTSSEKSVPRLGNRNLQHLQLTVIRRCQRGSPEVEWLEVANFFSERIQTYPLPDVAAAATRTALVR